MERITLGAPPEAVRLLSPHTTAGEPDSPCGGERRRRRREETEEEMEEEEEERGGEGGDPRGGAGAGRRGGGWKTGRRWFSPRSARSRRRHRSRAGSSDKRGGEPGAEATEGGRRDPRPLRSPLREVPEPLRPQREAPHRPRGLPFGVGAAARPRCSPPGCRLLPPLRG